MGCTTGRLPAGWTLNVFVFWRTGLSRALAAFQRPVNPPCAAAHGPSRYLPYVSGGSGSVVALNGRSPGLPVDRRQRLPNVYRQHENDEITA